MGQKVNPIGFRVGVTEPWNARWFVKKGYAENIKQDLYIRKFIKDKLNAAGVSTIIVERAANRIKVIVRCARPRLAIGRKGSSIEDLKIELKKKFAKEVAIDIIEIRKQDLDARLVAESVSNQLVRRVAFRRAMKDSIMKVMRAGAEGVKIAVSGRLGGADIARTEWTREGRVPLHTLRAQIDYGTAEALTTYGLIGVKVWIFRGERSESIDSTQPTNAPQAAN